MPLVSKTFSQIITFTRASTATFFDSAGVLQSAAIDAPRFDYDPSTLAAQGLLIEEARTNSFPASNDFANATYWTVFGTAVATAGAATGPDGLTSASNLAGATDITLSGNNIEDLINISASTAYAFSVFVKSNGGTTVTLRLRDSTGGSSSSTPFTVTSSWQRISMSRTMAAGATSVRCVIGATDGDILIYGAQLEAGAFPTSYIPTTTTALTRSADVASVNTLSPWYNASQGTLYAEWLTPSSDALNNRGIAAIDDGTNDNRVAMFIPGSGAPLPAAGRVVSGGSATNPANSGSIALSSVAKSVLAYGVGTNQAALSVNGGSPTTASPAATPVSVNILRIGTIFGVNNLGGTIRRITYYPRRLSNAELISLTT